MRLVEILTTEVFHLTSAFGAETILKSRSFRLKTSFATSAEEFASGKKFWYMSVARSKAGGFATVGATPGDVTLNLNGDWFNRHYKSAPVDYWKRKWLQDRNFNKNIFSEMEDRIFSEEPVIEFTDPKDVILEIHIWFPKTDLTLDVANLIYQCKKDKIPFYVYKSKEDFFTQNKSKTIPLKDLEIHSLSRPAKSKREIHTDLSNKSRLDPFIEMYHKNKVEDLSPAAVKQLKWILHGGHSLREQISYLRKRNPEAVVNFVKLMQKVGFKTDKDFYKFLIDKWKPLISD